MGPISYINTSGISSDNAKGIFFALSSSIFIGVSFTMKKKGFKKAGVACLQAALLFFMNSQVDYDTQKKLNRPLTRQFFSPILLEIKRLRLRKNNWESDTFQFDEVIFETTSQKQVYEVVAKPVIESVLSGYNGTVIAYGQTGTGKTFTFSQLREKDISQREIMVRALEDILVDINPANDFVTVSYLQVVINGK